MSTATTTETAPPDPPAPTVEPAARGGWIRRLWPFVVAHKRKVAIALGVVGRRQVVTALTPVIEKVVIDDVITTQRASRSGRGSSCSSVAAVIGFVAAYIRRYVGGRVALDVQYDLRNAIFERLQRLDFARHDELPTGQLVSRASSDLGLIQGLLSFTPIMVGNLVMVVVSLVVMVVPLAARSRSSPSSASPRCSSCRCGSG